MTTADEASILRVAEADRDHAARLLYDHMRAEHAAGNDGQIACPDCASFRGHAARTQRQVELLVPPAGADAEALF